MSASIKLGSLLVKTLSKPLANTLKRRAQSNPKFESFCINLAQAYNRADVNLKMTFFDYKTEPIKPLSEAKAVELGANFLSEIIIFSVGVLTILGETWRSSRSKNNQRHEMEKDILELEGKLMELKSKLALKSGELEMLNHTVTIQSSEILELKQLIENRIK
ncbi:hypothetical protein HDV04_005829 [Boothiomyces sp. JEL0838]|nr:hypothetical protein HDV04_005829 [Boothiomyces sp. JEL0838]